MELLYSHAKAINLKIAEAFSIKHFKLSLNFKFNELHDLLAIL